MPQQTFWRHDHERFAPGADCLTPQAMEILSRRCRINDLHIVFGAEMQKSFETRAGMFGTLAFEAMRQQQNETAEAFPFVFGAGDELIDDRLGRIPEIAKLSFPENQPVRIVEAEAVFETQDSGFRKQAVEDLNRSRIRIE